MGEGLYRGHPGALSAVIPGLTGTQDLNRRHPGLDPGPKVLFFLTFQLKVSEKTLDPGLRRGDGQYSDCSIIFQGRYDTEMQCAPPEIYPTTPY
jgi:hypothetical protein